MNSTIAISYPWWYIGLCLLLGALYAFVLYFKDNSFKDAGKRVQRYIKALSIFRFLVVSFLAFLLLMPLLKNRVTSVERPIIVYLQDNSESVKNALNADSAVFKNNTADLVSQLSQNYDLHQYQFGDEFKDSLDYTFDGKVTNIEAALEEIYNRYANQNVGGIIMATDGIYNEGSNPIYGTNNLNVPLYSIALGDTTPKRDIKIERSYYNKIAYLRDKFTLRIDVTATNCAKEGTTLKIFKINGSKKDKILTKTIYVKTNDFTKTYDLEIEATIPGINQYQIEIDKIPDEATTKNNVQRIYIDVLDSRQKILLLAAAPHPDITAIKSAIEKNENYETTTAYANNFNESLNTYDLVVLHGLPSRNEPVTQLLAEITNKSIPVFYVLSQQTNIAGFNSAQSLLQINGANNQINNAKADMQSGFTLFTLQNTMADNLVNLPPLNTPFGEYALGENAVSLLNQKIGTVNTTYPLLILEQSSAVKRAVLAGEGIWRWRMYDFQTDANHETVDELIGKTIQYLSVKSDKRKFRCSTAKNLYYENERISFDAELYNDSYELINDSDATLTITDAEGKAFPFNFNKTAAAYKLDAGIFPIGDYNFVAKTIYAGKNFESKGKFSVIPKQLEALNTVANHQLLNSLAGKSGGAIFYNNQTAAITDSITNNATIKPIMFSNFENSAFINLKWLFFVLLTFLALEWFIRKFNGGY